MTQKTGTGENSEISLPQELLSQSLLLFEEEDQENNINQSAGQEEQAPQKEEVPGIGEVENNDMPLDLDVETQENYLQAVKRELKEYLHQRAEYTDSLRHRILKKQKPIKTNDIGTSNDRERKMNVSPSKKHSLPPKSNIVVHEKSKKEENFPPKKTIKPTKKPKKNQEKYKPILFVTDRKDSAGRAKNRVKTIMPRFKKKKEEFLFPMDIHRESKKILVPEVTITSIKEGKRKKTGPLNIKPELKPLAINRRFFLNMSIDCSPPPVVKKKEKKADRKIAIGFEKFSMKI